MLDRIGCGQSLTYIDEAGHADGAEVDEVSKPLLESEREGGVHRADGRAGAGRRGFPLVVHVGQY